MQPNHYVFAWHTFQAYEDSERLAQSSRKPPPVFDYDFSGPIEIPKTHPQKFCGWVHLAANADQQKLVLDSEPIAHPCFLFVPDRATFIHESPSREHLQRFRQERLPIKIGSNREPVSALAP